MHNNDLIWINYIKKWKWLLTWRISKAWWVIFSLIIHHPRLCTRAYTLCFYVFNSFLTMDNVLFWRLCNELLIIFDFHCAFIIFFFIDDKVGERYEVLHVSISLQKTEICASKYMRTFRGESWYVCYYIA